MKLVHIEKSHANCLLDPSCGAFSVDIRCEDFYEMVRLGIEQVPSLTKAHSETLVSNYSYGCIDPNIMSIWKGFANQLASELNYEMNTHFDMGSMLEFDDLYFTHYPVSPMGVGPHRDTNCKNLVIVLVLTGTSNFCICKEKDLSGTSVIPCRAGQLMIMRAREFVGLEAPLHYVGAIQEPMLQFGMRQYITKPQQ